MELTAQNVFSIFASCFFTEGEAARLDSGDSPIKPVVAEGIRGDFGLHPERLELCRPLVTAWLREFPAEFHKGGGGGASFLRLCYRKGGVQWGEHKDMEALCVLAIALGLARWCAPRTMWKVLPGGMPYIVFDLDDRKEPADADTPAA